MASDSRILIIVTHGAVGGAQSFVLALARSLRARGEEVAVAFGVSAKAVAKEGHGDFLQEECEKSGIPYHKIQALRRTFNPFTNILLIAEARRLIDRERFDVVHINGSNALFAAIGARISRQRPRVVFTFHGLSFFDRGADVLAPIRLLVALAYRVLLWFVDVVVFVSRANYDTARERGLVRTGTVIHNGLPAPRPRQAGLDPEGLSFLERDIARRELEGITRSELKDTFLIGSIGRLDMAKNYEFLVEQMADIAAGHPHVRALIIGDGSERQKVEHLIKKRGLGKSVILAGEIPHAARYLKAFDVFILPSRYEGFSISILEALFAGIPILASDVGGAKEQLSHAPFQVYPPGNAKAFCERMERLIENPPVRKELAEANRARSGDFHIDKTADAYMRLYNV